MEEMGRGKVEQCRGGRGGGGVWREELTMMGTRVEKIKEKAKSKEGGICNMKDRQEDRDEGKGK